MIKRILLCIAILSLLIIPCYSDTCVLFDSTSRTTNSSGNWVNFTSLDTELIDTNNMHTGSNAYITIRKSDYYIVQCSIVLDGTSYSYLGVKVNNSLYYLMTYSNNKWKSGSSTMYLYENSIIFPQINYPGNPKIQSTQYYTPIFSVTSVNSSNNNSGGSSTEMTNSQEALLIIIAVCIGVLTFIKLYFFIIRREGE